MGQVNNPHDCPDLLEATLHKAIQASDGKICRDKGEPIPDKGIQISLNQLFLEDVLLLIIKEVADNVDTIKQNLPYYLSFPWKDYV